MRQKATGPTGPVSVGLLLAAAFPADSRADDPADSVPIDVLMDRPLPGPLVRIDPDARSPFLAENTGLGCFVADETEAAVMAYEQIRTALVSPPRLPGWGEQWGFAPRAFEGW